MADGRHFE